jgi:hypothetical protein
MIHTTHLTLKKAAKQPPVEPVVCPAELESGQVLYFDGVVKEDGTGYTGRAEIKLPDWSATHKPVIVETGFNTKPIRCREELNALVSKKVKELETAEEVSMGNSDPYADQNSSEIKTRTLRFPSVQDLAKKFSPVSAR